MTNSSALVGWIATHESMWVSQMIMNEEIPKSAFVAPILMATPNPCRISELPTPIICIPTIRSTNQKGSFPHVRVPFGPSQMSLYEVGPFFSSMAKYMATKSLL